MRPRAGVGLGAWLSLCVAGLTGCGEPRGVAAPEAAETLRAAFESGLGKARIVALLSPT